jgi:transposase
MNNDPSFSPIEYFTNRSNPLHTQYEAMKAYFIDQLSADEVANKFDYTVNTVYSMARDFRKALLDNPQTDPFFKPVVLGRKPLALAKETRDEIISLRKSYLSIPEIKSVMESKGKSMALTTIGDILKREGFARLPRRDRETKNSISIMNADKIMSERTCPLEFEQEEFSTQHAGLLCLLPFISYYKIDEAIQMSDYPETSAISRVSAILNFVALKLSSIKRYSSDDLWCMDRGLGLFSGSNILPKAAWFSSYSSGITRAMNLSFLKKLYGIWSNNGLIGDTANIDFTAIPYWGDCDSLENNWSGKRNKSLASMLAVLAQDPDSGIICYGDTTVRHDGQNDCVIEFLDFCRENGAPISYLVFDSKTTTYQNLNKLNKDGVKFITIKRRDQKVVEYINSIDKEKWKSIRVKQSNGKGRTVKIYEEKLSINGYIGELRHIYLTGNGKVKPAIIITNDVESSASFLVRKYSRRWLVEKEISEHIEFFHLNRNSSGMVIKVDFDLTMTILAHNIYRLLAQELPGHSHCESESLYNKFIDNAGFVSIDCANIIVSLKKKRNLPLILEAMSKFNGPISWLNNLRIHFKAASTT